MVDPTSSLDNETEQETVNYNFTIKEEKDNDCY